MINISTLPAPRTGIYVISLTLPDDSFSIVRYFIMVKDEGLNTNYYMLDRDAGYFTTPTNITYAGATSWALRYPVNNGSIELRPHPPSATTSTALWKVKLIKLA